MKFDNVEGQKKLEKKIVFYQSLLSIIKTFYRNFPFRLNSLFQDRTDRMIRSDLDIFLKISNFRLSEKK